MGACVGVFERPGERELAALEGEIAQLAAHIQAATHRLLCLIREFDDKGGWHSTGCRSLAHWLVWRIGLSPVAAREKVRVAKALPDLPLAAEALKKGEISYSKLRAISRVATPATEESLVTMAKAGTTAQVEKVVRSYRRVRAVEDLDRANHQHEGRYLQTYVDDDGMVVVKGRLDAETGAALLKALDVAADGLRSQARASRGEASEAESNGMDDARAKDVSGGTSVTEVSPGQLRADALGVVAQSALDHQMERGSVADRTQVVVHVDAAVLKDAEAEGESSIEPGIGVAAETSRRLCCDAAVVRVTEDAEGTPIDVGRKTRTIPPALRRALKSRDRTCRYPGCCRDRYLEGHHVQHWADGGKTSLHNLLHLCWYHHRQVHEGGCRIELDEAGRPQFYLSSGYPVRQQPPPPDRPASTDALCQQNAAAGLQLTARTLGTWDGYPVDYGWAVDILLRQQERYGSDPEVSPHKSPNPERP